MNPYLLYKQQKEAVAWTRIDMLLALYDGAIERLQAIVEALRVEIGLCPNLLSTSVTNLNHL